MTQREAAIEAVKQVGLNQKDAINPAWFTGQATEYEMFMRRLEELKCAKDVIVRDNYETKS